MPPYQQAQPQFGLPGHALAASPPPANPGWIATPPPMMPQNASGMVLQHPSAAGDIRWASTTALHAGPSQNQNWASSLSLPAIPQQTSTSTNNLTGGIGARQGVQLFDLVASKFDSVISCIDEEVFGGDERELVIYSYPQAPIANGPIEQDRSLSANAAAIASNSNHFSKVWLYANSRLPPHLPPLKLYMSTYPLICLAAQYSERVYTKSAGPERSSYINADFRRGTKAMVLKSLPIDDMNTIVFAIRGSQSIMDWSVNYRTAPTSPEDFLDDNGNYCHAGFLGVARKTAPLVAERLSTLLQENPGRCMASLLICGHSAGGAVAQLLYAHMMSQSKTVNSELKHLTSFFKRVHCVTFGAPPVSLLPLQKPVCKNSKKSLFFAFANEGDPVVRADKAVIASLLKLYASSPPDSSGIVNRTNDCVQNMTNGVVIAAAATGLKPNKKANGKAKPKPQRPEPAHSALPIWKIPPGTLSLGGTLVLLRERHGATNADDVEAFKVSDDQLRTVVFGDPVKHMMKLYARRVQLLATRAVTAESFG